MIQLVCTGPLPHLTPTLAAPRGREGAHAVSLSGPPPPFRGEGTGEVGGRGTGRHDANGSTMMFDERVSP